MKRYRATVKFKDGSVQRVTVMAEDRDDAKKQVEFQQFRRQERGPLTFSRLEQAADSGQPGMLSIDPKFGGQALTEAWVAAETEKRKADLGRYEKPYTIDKIEEVK
jgi:hypothetical protein